MPRYPGTEEVCRIGRNKLRHQYYSIPEDQRHGPPPSAICSFSAPQKIGCYCLGALLYSPAYCIASSAMHPLQDVAWYPGTRVPWHGLSSLFLRRGTKIDTSILKLETGKIVKCK
eukprot:2827693-Rhodomonas_salina.1